MQQKKGKFKITNRICDRAYTRLHSSSSNETYIDLHVISQKKELHVISIKEKYKPEILNISQNIAYTQQVKIYTPPYNSIWFRTENNISLEAYISTLYYISKAHLDTNTNVNMNMNMNMNKSSKIANSIKGILVPESGIRYSGLCSATAYCQLKQSNNTYYKPIKRIILFCTDHSVKDNVNSKNFITTSYTHISRYNSEDKPIIHIDQITINKLRENIAIDDECFNNAYSFYNQLPFIESINSNNSNNSNNKILVLPFIISNNLILDNTNCSKIKKILSVLKDLLINDNTVLICTSDLSHINGEYTHKINTNIYQNIRKQDNLILQFLYDGVNGVVSKTRKIDDILFITNAPSHGTMAIYMFSKLLNSYSGGVDSSSSSSSSDDSCDSSSSNVKYQKPALKLWSKVSCYYTSQMCSNFSTLAFNSFIPAHLTKVLKINDTTKSSVSYASVIFTLQPSINSNNKRKIENIFTQYEKLALIGLLKEQLTYQLDAHKYNPSNPSNIIDPVNCSIFNQRLGVYISISKNDKIIAYNGSSQTNNEDYTITTYIKRFVTELMTNNNNNNNLQSLNNLELLQSTQQSSLVSLLSTDAIDNFSYNITILYHLQPITLNEYVSNKFNINSDGILLVQKKANQTKTAFDLPSIKKAYKAYNAYKSSITTGIVDIYDDKTEASHLHILEKLCTTKLNSSSKDCYRMPGFNLFFNEGLIFSST